jgi:hypothetical protein
MARIQTKEDILSGFKINPVVKKIQSDRNKWIQLVRQKDSQTFTLNYEISTMWKMTSHKTSRILMGLEQVMRPKTLQAV